MAFIVKKTISGKDYYYLNENKRVDGKVKTKTLAYLGKTKKDAEKKKVEIMNNLIPSRAREVTSKMENEKNQEEGKIGEEKIVIMEKNELKHEKILIEEVKLSREEKADKIFSIAGTRGFFFNTASIYGGKAGFYTYGHLGKLLKTNWENLWRKNILSLEDNFYEIQSNNILPESVFIASGHVEGFNDPMVECKKCHLRFRVDNFLEEHGVENTGTLSIEEMNKLIKEKNLKCQKCSGELSEVLQFNMMFPVSVGIGANSKAYLGPETAQGAYLAFKDEFLATRGKLPMGLAIIDKAYRNEISPRQGFFRLREFSQAELQIFFDPDKINEHEKWSEVMDKKLFIKFADSNQTEEISCSDLNKKKGVPKFYIYYASKVQDFYLKIIGIPKNKFRLRELNEKERAFYNKIHFDMEIILDTIGGFKEVGGIHYRTDHDLGAHQKVSGKDLSINIDGKKFIPHVLELSFGDDRNIFALFDVFFNVGKEGAMFKLPSKLAPIKAAIFPIVKKNNFEKIAKDIADDLKKEWNIVYDKSGSIGRRYARNDEIGTPFCITVDGDSLKKKDVTIRDRDTTRQIRVKISELKNVLRKLINQEIKFVDAGKLVK